MQKPGKTFHIHLYWNFLRCSMSRIAKHASGARKGSRSPLKRSLGTDIMPAFKLKNYFIIQQEVVLLTQFAFQILPAWVTELDYYSE